jgi:hypothetical protein
MMVILDSDEISLAEIWPSTLCHILKGKKMDLTCFNCKETWDVPQTQIIGAKLKFALGFDDHEFPCPNCDTKNMITKEEFEKSMDDRSQAPSTTVSSAKTGEDIRDVRSSNGLNDSESEGDMSDASDADSGGIRSGSDIRAHSGTISAQSTVGKSSPLNPATGPGPSLQGMQRQGIIIATSLDIHKDHSTSSESMGRLVPGDNVTILNTWTDGENTWAQLGPERWAAIIYNGEALIDLVDES